MDQASSAGYYLVSEVQWPSCETGKKIRHRHVNVVVVGACSEAWRFVHCDKHENVANEGGQADHSHGCCEKYRDSVWARRLMRGVDVRVGGVVHGDREVVFNNSVEMTFVFKINVQKVALI